MATPEKYSHIDFKPPSGVRREAEYGLKLRREHGRGGTAVGIARARDLSNGVEVSPSTVRRMKAFFDRHASDEKAPGFSRGDKEWPSNGLIANKLWGGPSGYSWAKKVVGQMNAADEKDSRELRPYGSTHGIKPKVVVVHGPPGSGKSTYVSSKKSDDDVVFDFDAVMSAISGRPMYEKSEPLISYCMDIRSLILKRAVQGKRDGKTWVIATSVSDELKSQLSDIPVSYVHMDTPKEVCLKRVSEDPAMNQHEEELRNVIEEYFAGQEEQRLAPAVPNVERRFLGNFSESERPDPELLRVERRADPSTGKPRTYIVGYAARFHRDSLLLGDFVERIDPSAFEIVESRTDSEGKPLQTRCLFNHDPNYLLGRFPTTMTLSVDDKGLKYTVLLPESRSDIAESVERGDLRGSSFSFVVADGGERWSTEDGRSIRLVTKIKSLLDCGPVTWPAYGDANISVAKRSYETYCNSRAFCATGQGGGVDNSCSPAAKFAGQVASTIEAMDDAAAGGKTVAGKIASGYTAGAIGGLTVGALGGLGGAIAGSITGGLIGAAISGAVAIGSSIAKSRVAGLQKKIGVSDSQIAKASGSLFGDKSQPMVHSVDKKTLSVSTSDAKSGIALVRDGSLFSKESAGVSLHYQPGIGAKGQVDVKSLESAAKSVSASHVSVEAWSDDAVNSLVKSGYKRVAESPDGYSSSKGVYEKRLKASRRSIDSLREFLAERRGGDCGRDAGGRFGSGNECQDEGSGGEYMEYDKDNHNDAQDFIDRAREGQLKRGGKDGGKSDDGGGVQTWSKGDDYPWTIKQVGDGDGYLQAQHPDGSKTEKYPFKGGDTSEAAKKLQAELKRRVKKDVRSRYSDLLKWAERRA